MRWPPLLFALLLPVPPVMSQQPETRQVVEVTQNWHFGVRVEAKAGAVAGIEVRLPFPAPWPEQDVRLLQINRSDTVSKVTFEDLGDGARQMVVTIARLRQGESATAVAEVEIKRRIIEAPRKIDAWRVPHRRSSRLKPYLSPSPYIESRHRTIRKTAAEIVSAAPPTGWRKVEAIYDWVRRQVRYEFDPKIRSSLEALQSGKGDCEELTSLFIALCRAEGIPARSVWVPGHCYPEFYLKNEQGEGRWFPCQAAGTRLFGEMIEWRPILQKGDRFKVPGKKGYQRYVAESLKAKHAAAPPAVTFIREAVGEAVASKLAEQP